jgi:hypothetical protein
MENNKETYNKELDLFMERFEHAMNNSLFIKLILSNNRSKKHDLKKLSIVPVKIKNELLYSHVYTHQTKDITKNYTFEETKKTVLENLKVFLNADLFTRDENVQLFSNRKISKSLLKLSEPLLKEIPAMSHDRTKKQRIRTENNLYLQALNVTDKSGTIKKNMHDKFRQINKYLEILDHLIAESGFKNGIKITDMGSGKGYLTFALYDFLETQLKLHPVIKGIEIRPDLVETCNSIAKQCEFENLKFENSDILSSKPEPTDILIALHACDTATDDAIIRGIKLQTKLIVVAPCCHKQVRKEMNVVNAYGSVMKHGILKERQAELITDGIRALILELYGYKTKVFEFVSSEHTPKNLMIAAVKHNADVQKEKIHTTIKAIKDMYGIESHYLEKLFTIVPY